MYYEKKKKWKRYVFKNQRTLSRSKFKNITEKSQYDVTQSINSDYPRKIQIQKSDSNRIDSQRHQINDVP